VRLLNYDQTWRVVDLPAGEEAGWGRTTEGAAPDCHINVSASRDRQSCAGGSGIARFDCACEILPGMGVFARTILPRLIHAGMRQELFMPYRRRLVRDAQGRVLEIGFGSGLNVSLYTAPVAAVVGLDPSRVALSIARASAGEMPRPLELLEASAETIPLVTHSVDTIVCAWTLCSIPDVARALSEVHRVLKPSGIFLFVEHGRAPDAPVAKWQDRLTPIWKHVAGGCHLNRPVAALVERAGFRIERLDTGYMKGPRPMTFMYEGCARPV
jgi:SAM-dependent methyltransferase